MGLVHLNFSSPQVLRDCAEKESTLLSTSYYSSEQSVKENLICQAGSGSYLVLVNQSGPDPKADTGALLFIHSTVNKCLISLVTKTDGVLIRILMAGQVRKVF